MRSVPLSQSCQSEPTLSGTSVCAVMVTYHPSAGMIEHLQKVRTEVHGGVIVDNGSAPDELRLLRIASRDLGLQLIENGENRGIAEALNQGVRWARQQGFSWVLLLDQDSRMNDDFLRAMLQTWTSHPRHAQVAAIHPRYMHPQLGCRPLAPRASDGSYLWCMTSGTLMPTWVFDKIGYFASEFFIDWVDIEYCFRLRKAGYTIAESSEAILLHDPGDSAPSHILGRRFWPSHHNPVRRYYMSRNRIVVFRKYFLSLPLWTLKAMHAAFRDTLKCFLGETDRRRKFRNFLLGTWDGFIGRMGQRQGL